MGFKIDNDYVRAAMTKILTAPDGSARRVASEELVLYLHGNEVLESWGRHLSRLYRRIGDWQEFTQVVTESIVKKLRYLTEKDAQQASENPSAWLFYRAKEGARSWADSPSVTLASVMSGVNRRHRRAIAAQRELTAKLGREPSPQEVVDYANQQALETRSDAARQGALISLEDVDGSLLRSLSIDYTVGEDDLSITDVIPSDEDVTLRAELSVTVQHLGVVARRMYPGDDGERVCEAFAAWTELVMVGAQPTVRRLAGEMSIGHNEASELLFKVNDLLRVFREDDAAA